MNYNRDTAFGAAALVVLLVLYVRGVPQALWSAVVSGGKTPSDAAAAPPATGQGGAAAPPSGGNPPPAGSPPGIAPDKYTSPVLDATLGTGATDAYNQFHGVPTLSGGDTWYDVIFPCIMRTGSVSACLPKG